MLKSGRAVGHDFHRHPVQEEVIIVTAGEIEQWVGEEVSILRPGDSAFIVASRVHASFNLSPETAHLRVVIAPAVGMGSGYELEDVSGAATVGLASLTVVAALQLVAIKPVAPVPPPCASGGDHRRCYCPHGLN